ncbi:iduronate-2-sulfatase [Bacteroidia bacterium]|nr:iduronate-2-sulfatase [Bacteroidia bacterium]
MFIISDQHKLAVTGCYGDKVVKTPNIDALAANGVKFTRIYTPSPLSAPARAALITGTYPSTNEVLLHQMPFVKNGKKGYTEAGKQRVGYKEGMVTWGEWMKERGFGTAAIGKMHVHGELQKGVNPDYPEGNLMGFDVSNMRFYSYFPGGHYRDWKGSADYYNRYREISQYASYFKGNQFNQNLKPTLVEKDEDIFDFAVASLSNEYIARQASEGKPFFIHVGLEKPHKPWTTAQRFYDMYTTEQMQMPRTAYDWRDNGRYPYVKKGGHSSLFDPKSEVNQTEVKNSMRAYYACVTEMDEAVGQIVEQTKRLGIYQKTIFVYTTDHGEHLFEHGLHEKHNMFEDAVNIPFIISCPALLPKGVTCNSPGSMVDVLPTIAELLGYRPAEQWQGRSLVGQITASKPWDRVIYSEFYQTGFAPWEQENVPMKMYLDNKYKYVYTHGYIDQLFDIRVDHDEMHNLALDKKYAAMVERYRFLALHDWLFWLMPRMDCRLDGTTLAWTAIPEARSYTLWHSKTPDANAAVKVADTEALSFPARTGGYWWVVANWNYTDKGERRERVPMITGAFPKTLPVSRMIEI